jgi:hypothetical protein
MYLAQPAKKAEISHNDLRQHIDDEGNPLQYANLRPRNLPANGMMIMLSRSCSCSKLASHSFCASDKSASESESRMLLEIDGRESTSSLSEGAMSGMMKDPDELVMVDMSDMASVAAFEARNGVDGCAASIRFADFGRG